MISNYYPEHLSIQEGVTANRHRCRRRHRSCHAFSPLREVYYLFPLISSSSNFTERCDRSANTRGSPQTQQADAVGHLWSNYANCLCSIRFGFLANDKGELLSNMAGAEVH